ncbi:hypothetical protein SODG_003292 [Sodalis praecaptivus]
MKNDVFAIILRRRITHKTNAVLLSLRISGSAQDFDAVFEFTDISPSRGSNQMANQVCGNVNVLFEALRFSLEKGGYQRQFLTKRA